MDNPPSLASLSTANSRITTTEAVEANKTSVVRSRALVKRRADSCIDRMDQM